MCKLIKLYCLISVQKDLDLYYKGQINQLRTFVIC